MQHITAERLRELVEYESESGIFRWRAVQGRRVRVGKIAGHRATHGYVTIRLDGRPYYAHRMAWLYVYGKMPDHQVDHINGVRSDNRISNLRDVDATTNLLGFRTPRKNKFGYAGVTYSKSKSKPFAAQITIDGVHHNLGYFETAIDAHLAFMRARSLRSADSSAPQPDGSRSGAAE